MENTSKKSWDDHYLNDSALRHHRAQNEAITKDFLIHASCRPVPEIMNALQTSKVIIEHGCGTGEMVAFLAKHFPNTKFIGTEYSENVLKATNIYSGQIKNVTYQLCDVMNDDLPLPGADLAIMSNVLEHFSNWKLVVDKLLFAYKKVLIIVPYKERLDACPPQGGGEGGMGHHASFSEESFSSLGYDIIRDMVFFSLQGWGVSWAGECPLQYAVLLRGRSNN